MAGKLAYERYHWSHGQIIQSRYPNASILAKQFEISKKQAQRDIEFIRDRLGAPLRYNGMKRGYEYKESGYELPPVWFSGDELMAFCLALRIATTIPDSTLKKSLKGFLEKFLSLRSLEDTYSIKEIETLISVKNIEYYRVKDEVFRTTINALFRKRPLEISYRSPHRGEETERVILPLHLLCYMGSWHLIAYCSLRNELRDFSLSRILKIKAVDKTINLPSDLPPIKDYIRKHFGVMVGDESKEVVLKFAPRISSWISEQIWHDKQEIIPNNDGSLYLRFYVASYEEVAREILKYGSDVEVFSPLELRAIISSEIEKMKEIYR